MEFAGEFIGLHCDSRIHQYLRTHRTNWFPVLGSGTVFAKQAASLRLG